MSSKLQVKLNHEYATVPTLGSDNAAGYDLYSVETKEIPPMSRVVIKTGIHITVPPGTYGRIAPRSGLAIKHWVDVCAGVVDRDYTGEVMVVLHNYKDEPFTVNTGDRIAQLIFELIINPPITQVSDLEESKRGDDGFGSTGR